MSQPFLCTLLLTFFLTSASAQTDTIAAYKKKSYMIPMRDGTKLFTVVFTPENSNKACPFLIERTPYGAYMPMPDDTTLSVNVMGTLKPMAKEGYIFVFQDIRGKFKSEGTFEMTRPLYHLVDKTS